MGILVHFSGVTLITTLTEYTEKVTNSHGLICVLIYSSDDPYSETLYQNLITMSNNTAFERVQFFAVNLINTAVRNQLMISENALTFEKAVVRFYFKGKQYKSLTFNSTSITNAVGEIKTKLLDLLSHNIIIT